MAQGIEFARILVFSPDDPREAIMTTPALRAIKRRFPSATIDITVPPAAETVAPLLPFADHVSSRRDRGEQERICMMSRLRYEAAVIFTSHRQSPHPDAYGCYLAGIPVRIGMSAEFAGGVLSHWIKPLPNVHPVDRHFSLVASIGLADAGRRLELRLPIDAVHPILEHPALQAEGRYVAVMYRGPIDRAIVAALVERLKTPVLSAYDSASGLSLLYRSPRADDIEWEQEESRGTEMLKADLISRALVIVTDDCLAALIAEALGRHILFFGDSTALDRQYWPTEATVLEGAEPSLDTIAAHVQKMLASMRS